MKSRRPDPITRSPRTLDASELASIRGGDHVENPSNTPMLLKQHVDNPGQTAMDQHVDNPGQTPM